ncbi:LuxR C-terminal-related transcriptional regulator [Chromohalobacter moromii]|uniref:LuxR C-terminal-related transcriptional regulator n=1 Tax=Chromohalobacter moromii TaxID=2860329 RepID=A0A9X3AY34_9GAMM|nr:LuxR C-terminal-related transcriptional regulator [Chromohalobacter moromii]MCT8506172.1 LuxR C-terminal-related transcriptional regulator [Chromohalobacter moromii]
MDTQTQETIEFAGYRCRVGRQTQGLPTAKQAQVIAGLAAGMTQKEIARLRGVSPTTVKSTAESLYFWLHAARASAAVAEALKRGWIAPLMLALTVGALAPDMHMQRVRQPRTRVQITKQSRREESAMIGGGIAA